MKKILFREITSNKARRFIHLLAEIGGRLREKKKKGKKEEKRRKEEEKKREKGRREIYTKKDA